MDLRGEVERLAAMPMIDFITELNETNIAKGFGISKADLKAMVAECRKALKQQQRMKDSAARRGKMEFAIGSMVEIARHFAAALRQEYQENIAHDEGAFWCYEQTEWRKIEDDDIRRMIFAYDGVVYGDGDRERMFQLNSTKIDSVINETITLLKAKDFFSNAPWGINCLSGFIRFDDDGTPNLLPHDPAHRARHTIQAHWSPTAANEPGAPHDGAHGAPGITAAAGAPRGQPVNITGTKLDRFLTTLLQFFRHPTDYRTLVQEMFGAAISGSATALLQPKAFILLGEQANNGKSTLISLLRSCVPANVVSSIAPELFSDKEYRAKLVGVLLNTADELSVKALSAGYFKRFVDGKNDVDARDLYEKVMLFQPRALHVFATQKSPRFFDGIDAGVQRRAVLVNFEGSIPQDQMIRDIDQQIIAEEMDLLFAFAVEGACRLLRRRNYTLPRDIDEQIERWQRENDTVMDWIMRRVSRHDPELHGKVPPSYTPHAVFQHYRDWCRLWEISHPVDKSTFFQRVRQKYPELDFYKRSATTRQTITGVVLLDNDDGTLPQQVFDQDGEPIVRQILVRR